MRQLNARLSVVVAAVAVAAVAGGGVFAYRQGPQNSTTGASPLGGQPAPGPTPTPKPSATPTKTPSVTPTAPTATKPGLTGPKTVAISLAKLKEGRSPQLVHSLNRVVSGGAAQAHTVPGKARIIASAQVGNATYVIEAREPDLVLVRNDLAGETTEVSDVTTLVASADASTAAYATQKQKSTGEQLRGSTIYADYGMERKKLDLANSWNVQVLAVAGGKVWYAATPTEAGQPKLYSWDPDRSAATLVKGVASPTAISADGRLVSSLESIADGGSCSVVRELATNKQLLRTCEYMVKGFTPDNSMVIAGPAYEDGYASLSSWLLNLNGGALLREWTGVAFRHVRAEDDQHLLMEVDDGPDTKGAIIRCTITDGACERATPITPGDQFGLGS